MQSLIDVGFTRAVPSTITPWPHNFSAPTPRFTQRLSSCPVDWSTITGLKPEQIEAYELRAPWNPAPATFTVVAHQTQYVVNGKVPSEECVRKRFKKACSELFKRTGVYFVHSAIGLDEYGVPKKQQVLNDMIDQLANGTAYTAVRNNAAPTLTPTISAALTRKRPAHCRVIRRALRHHESRLYEGEVVALRLQADRDGQSVIRVCDKKLARRYHALIDYKVSVGIMEELDCQAQVPDLSFSPAAYDLWHSSVCFGRRHTIPQRVTICREVCNDRYQLRDGGVPCSPTTKLLIETYRLSQRMGSTDASDLILDEIVRRLTSTSFAGFAPEDIAMLQNLRTDDALVVAVNDLLHQTVESKSDSEDDRASSAVDFADADTVCTLYHNHTKSQVCYRQKPESSILYPDLASWKLLAKEKALMESEQ